MFGVMLLALFPALQAEAENYPAKAVRMVVPYAPGGSVDVMARILAPKLTGNLVERFAKDGTEVIVSSPGQFASHIKVELARWARVVKEAGLRAD